MRNLRISTILLLILCWAPSFSQELPDYLLTSKGDSLVGKVRIMSFETDQAQVKVDGKKKTFPATQVVALRMANEIYRPQRRNGVYRFMKLLIPGYLSLYGFKDANQNMYDSRFLSKRDGQTLEVPNLTFKKNMREFLEDCPSVVSKLETGEFSRRNLEEVVAGYNSCINAATTQRVMEAKMYVQESDVRMVTFEKLRSKVSLLQDFGDKQNTLELLGDIKSKFSQGQRVAAYQISGLKEFLQNQESVKPELDEFLQALAKN